MKTNWLKILNPFLGFVFLFQVIIGFFNEYIPEDLFESMHKTCAIILLICIFAHIYLNWNWVRVTFFKKK